MNGSSRIPTPDAGVPDDCCESVAEPSMPVAERLSPKDKVRWYREQVVNNQPVHLAYRKDQVLLISYPLKGINLHVTVRTVDEMAEALLMILTYPGPPGPAAGGAR